ncbi:hypothetical protein UK23_33900 [Lentzea aerocolonigenes]|uniref:Uncharacterized protein n=1 Tax=Lentzea aerocolonigenes TaxID=68170 RepID=A0A0F0GIB1_LENAE|nr:hypothetical protein [Lentzea aerocolonigenes]KJK43269.1 hypothetical protein UK23_33900 [Lentzea aerocolonigenes]
MTECGPEAEAVTRGLGFDCHDVSPVVSMRPPWELANWTLPLLELLVIAGAVFALVHAIRRRRAGDPTNLALWWTSLVYLFVIEPPLYFPEWFGLDDIYGFIFAHNQFTVQFMWDRLPLYIIAFYPMISQLAYEVVRSLGIFAQRGALAGSVAVAFVCQVFYEVFDHIGPQLKWWAWNPANAMVNQPMMGSVPMKSALLFASVSLGAMTYLVVRLPGRWRLAAGLPAPLSMVIAGSPASLFGTDVTGQAWVLGAELALIWVAGVWLIVTAQGLPDVSAFARIYPACYLGVMAVFWVTVSGVPITSVVYALTCFAGAGLVLARLYRVRVLV